MLGETFNNYKGKGNLQIFPWGKHHCLSTQTQENTMEAKKTKILNYAYRRQEGSHSPIPCLCTFESCWCNKQIPSILMPS